jgi:adenosylmethionine-8-amino-7-oxononanoate aminotransferase
VCAAGLANIDILEREQLLGEVPRIGRRLGGGLSAIAADGGVDHVRGLPAMYAVGLRPDQNAMVIRDSMLRRGVITRAIGTDTLTFCPPLVTTDEQLDHIVDALATSVAES